MELAHYLELVDMAVSACDLPDRLHPYSERVLNLFRDGVITESTFRFYFHMFDSSYYRHTQCILDTLEASVLAASGSGGPD